MIARAILLLLVIAAAVATTSCGERLTRRVRVPQSVSAVTDTVLKLHLHDGGLVVLSHPAVDQTLRAFRGDATRYDADRMLLSAGADTIAFDSIALVESNQIHTSGATYAMAAMSTVSVAMTVYCMANPKACFGSCPTFYAWDGDTMRLQAEGFSSSIAPVLRATDLDALPRWRRRDDGPIELLVTNEALETHVIDHIELLAARRPANGRVVADGSRRLHAVTDIRPLDRVTAFEGDIGSLVDAHDGRERISLASETDLAERETIELAASVADTGERALLVGFRESLMTTYLFYQGLAYLGTEAGAMIARMNRDTAAAHAALRSMQGVLGGIDVEMIDATGAWRVVATIDEAGPIASNLQMVPLPRPSAPGDSLRLRLRMAKGLWRIDYLALARVRGEVEPVRMRPVEAIRDGTRDTAALAALVDPSRSLVTMPGDRITLRFAPPGSPEHAMLASDADGVELFLESRGYYLEWMRTEWLAEQNPAKAAQMFLMPAEYLRAEAPRFKQIEPVIEHYFWGSRYANP